MTPRWSALGEVTLVWVLFADASRVGPREIRADLGLYSLSLEPDGR